MCLIFDIENLSLDYTVKKFTEEDLPEIYSLCKKNQTYYKYMNMKPNYENLKEVITDLPINKTMEDKFFVGLYKENCLIAILDLILKYPDTDTAFIGWFMLNKDFQRKGIASKIITDLFLYLKECGFLNVRLGYIKENNESKRFWIRNGLIPTGLEIQEENYKIIVMERVL